VLRVEQGLPAVERRCGNLRTLGKSVVNGSWHGAYMSGEHSGSPRLSKIRLGRSLHALLVWQRLRYNITAVENYCATALLLGQVVRT